MILFRFLLFKGGQVKQSLWIPDPQVNVTSYDKYWSLNFLDSSMHHYYSMYMHSISGRVM